MGELVAFFASAYPENALAFREGFVSTTVTPPRYDGTASVYKSSPPQFTGVVMPPTCYNRCRRSRGFNHWARRGSSRAHVWLGPRNVTASSQLHGEQPSDHASRPQRHADLMSGDDLQAPCRNSLRQDREIGAKSKHQYCPASLARASWQSLCGSKGRAAAPATEDSRRHRCVLPYGWHGAFVCQGYWCGLTICGVRCD